MSYYFSIEIERGEGADYECCEVDVTYSVNPYYPATRYQPEEGGDVEIEAVEYHGKPFDLTDAEYALVVEAAQARCEDDAADEEADYGDYLHDMRREMEDC